MLSYQVIALDLDGTLTDSHKQVTPRTLHALLDAQRRGLRVVLASGRPPYGIAPIADLLNIADYGGYILAYNGGQLIDWRTREVLYQRTLYAADIPYFYECARREGFEILTYDGDEVICENPDNEYVRYECALNKIPCRRVPRFLDAVSGLKPKCLIVGEPERLARLEEEMSAQLAATTAVFRSEPFFLELVPQGVDKGRALGALLAYLGLTADRLIACGDGYNDLSMIRYAGLGVAMANACPPVRAAADFVTLSNDDDGVAAVIDRFFPAGE